MSVVSHFSFVEEEKSLSMECSKACEGISQEKEEPKIDAVTERNEVDVDEENDNEICEEREDTVEFGKIVDDDKEAVEMTETDCLEQDDGLAGEKSGKTSDKTSREPETVGDLTNTDNQPLAGDDECEVTSPDIIPSSQTPSYESPFQSLRRVTIPLSSILPSSLDLQRNRGNVAKNQLEKTQAKAESTGENVALETQEGDNVEGDEVGECDSPMKQDEPALSVSKTSVSPVAGRTRRKLQQKNEGDKTPSRKEREDEPTEHEVSKLMQDDKDLDKTHTQASTEKPAEPTLAGVSRGATSSPVPSVKNKFLRPFSAGGSPCRATLHGRNSPGVSPTTGILKRWPGNKQSVDSPSPPGKVRHCVLF